MTTSLDAGETRAALPDPGAARTLDDLIERLRLLKIWAGDPSYETIKDRINAVWVGSGRPAGELARKNTVADCFRTGRRRVNTDLVIAVVEALHADAGYVAHWRQALRVVLAETQASSQVRAQDALPDDNPEFTGRQDELDRLRRVLGEAGGSGAVAIEGMAGVGKTQLAIHAGHLLARDEPFERVLFVNLRGFHPDPGQPPAEPAAVLDSFLRLLGVPGQQIPHTLEGRVAKYRECLAGRRALVVLDNAADEAQAEPLLPGSPGSVTLVTSRRSLAKLLPVVHLQVAVFTPAEAADFLARAVPEVTRGDDPGVLARVAERCGYLPLALGLVAGHMRGRPDWTFTDHAEWLEERHRAGRLDDGLELALALSYQHLPPERRHLLRMLSIHPGTDVDGYAAAALTGLDPDSADEHLRQLSDDHVLQQTAPGRYVFHDLVRAFASGRATDEERPAARREALGRLFDHYLAASAVAMDLVFPAERQHRPPVPPPTTPPAPMADADAARAWLDTERANLIATAVHAATHGPAGYTVTLAATIFRYLDTSGHLADAISLHTHASRAAREAGDLAGEAHALNNLAGAYRRQGHHRQAAGYFRQALALFRETDDRLGEARTLGNLGVVSWRLGRYEQAADWGRQSIEVYERVGNRLGAARARGNVGGAYWRLGRYAEAEELFQQALAVYRELDDTQDEADALNLLGLVYLRQGRYREAVAYNAESMRLHRESGYRIGDAQVSTDLGIAHLRLGQVDTAVGHIRYALGIFEQIDDVGGQAEARNGLGECLLAQDRPGGAHEQHTAALALATETGDHYEQARAFSCLARIHQLSGATDRAREHWQQALTRYAELGVPEAGEVRAHLAALG